MHWMPNLNFFTSWVFSSFKRNQTDKSRSFIRSVNSPSYYYWRYQTIRWFICIVLPVLSWKEYFDKSRAMWRSNWFIVIPPWRCIFYVVLGCFDFMFAFIIELLCNGWLRKKIWGRVWARTQNLSLKRTSWLATALRLWRISILVINDFELIVE